MNRYRIRTMVVLEELHLEKGHEPQYLPRFTRSSTVESPTLGISDAAAEQTSINVEHDISRIRKDVADHSNN